MKRYISAKQAVQLLNGSISVKTVYKLCSQGKLRANRATGKILIEEDSLIELMEGPPRPPPPPEEPPPKRRPPGRPKKNPLPLW